MEDEIKIIDKDSKTVVTLTKEIEDRLIEELGKEKYEEIFGLK